MTAQDQSMTQQPTARRQVGEWFWRFLAVVMLAAVGWVVWISYQLNPQPLVTMAAFEAAAKARASRNTQGLIVPAVRPAEAAASAPASAPSPSPAPASASAESQPPRPEVSAPAAVPAAAAEPKEPPVNLEKLKLSDRIATPIPDRAKKK
ncbi:MAG: hypothetical protein ACREUO_08505 [Burkholderiales bacterium]